MWKAYNSVDFTAICCDAIKYFLGLFMCTEMTFEVWSSSMTGHLYKTVHDRESKPVDHKSDALATTQPSHILVQSNCRWSRHLSSVAARLIDTRQITTVIECHIRCFVVAGLIAMSPRTAHLRHAMKTRDVGILKTSIHCRFRISITNRRTEHVRGFCVHR